MIVTVSDSFEFRQGLIGSNHAQGVVAVFDAAGLPAQIPGAGVSVSVRRPDGSTIELAIGEAKELGNTAKSYFFSGLHLHEVPLGSKIAWDDDSRRWRQTGAAVAAGGQGL